MLNAKLALMQRAPHQKWPQMTVGLTDVVQSFTRCGESDA
jgi:hypothetical protein